MQHFSKISFSKAQFESIFFLWRKVHLLFFFRKWKMVFYSRRNVKYYKRFLTIFLHWEEKNIILNFFFLVTSLSKKMKAKIVYHKECKSFMQFAKNNFSVALTFLHFLAFFVSLICKKWSINAQLTTDLSMYW